MLKSRDIGISTNYIHVHNTFNDREVYDICQLEGSSRSGKSWAVSQFICSYLKTNRGKTITIGRDTLANLKLTTYETLKKVFEQFGMPLSVFNKSATSFYYNGNLVRFVGVVENVMKAHGLEQDILWLNECNNIPQFTMNQMVQRTSSLTLLDYNPSDLDSYLYDQSKLDNVAYKKSTFLDNPYVPEKQKKKILSYAHPDVADGDMYIRLGLSLKEWALFKRKNLENNTANAFEWKVYGLGERAIGEDNIFPRFKIVDNIPTPPKKSMTRYGGDFGSGKAPTAFVECTLIGNDVYLREILYESGLSDYETCVRLQDYKKEISYWDSAQKLSIRQFRAGYTNEDPSKPKYTLRAYPAKKGAGSVWFGIKILQGLNIHIHKDSENLIKEFKGYKWDKDQRGNYKVDSKKHQVPIKENDHGIDAARYCVTQMKVNPNEVLEGNELSKQEQEWLD